jgi:hypothetical protein
MDQPDAPPLAAGGFLGALAAAGPIAGYRSKMALFGRFVGSWDIEGRFFEQDGRITDQHHGEWHFGWVLEGRAIQDVLIRPTRAGRPAGRASDEYGTTVRVFDPGIDGWRVIWIAAVSGRVISLVAREHGDEIWIDGTGPGGVPYRWTFSEIADDYFRWQGYQSADSGGSWFKGQEMIARRAGR